jgi:hypothetical protein
LLSASLYIILCSARNRTRMRLRRLREPRYLIGAVVGAVYLYFSVFARMRPRGGIVRRRAEPPSGLMLDALRAGAPGAVGLALLAAAVAWLPLAVFSLAQARSTDVPGAVSFWRDVGAHARYLISVPLLILGSGFCVPRLWQIIEHFPEAGLIGDVDRFWRHEEFAKARAVRGK